MFESTDNNTQPKKPSKLEEFKLFYESVDTPDYDTIGKNSAASSKKSFRDRPISRRRR